MKRLADRTRTSERVLAVLRRLRDRRGRVALSSRGIGERAGFSHTTIRSAIADLAARGSIEVIRAGGNGSGGDPGTYRVVVP